MSIIHNVKRRCFRLSCCQLTLVILINVIILLVVRHALLVYPLYPSRLKYDINKFIHRHQCTDALGNTLQLHQPSSRSAWSKRRLWMDGRGRLGNAIFNFIGSYALAKTNNRDLYVTPKLAYHLWEVFDTSGAMFGVCEMPEVMAKEYFKYAKYENKTEDLPFADLELCWYTQTWRYFQRYEKQVRRILKFHDLFLEEAQQFLHDTNSGSPNIQTFIGVHVRRADMSNDPVAHQLGFRSAPASYLQKAVQYYTNKYIDAHFIVCSDDPAWCQNQKVFTDLQPNQVTFSVGYSEGFDLALLAQCNHTIMTVGTFSWWAGWLAGGEVVYYNQPVRKGSRIAKDFEAKDFFLPNWKGLGG